MTTSCIAATTCGGVEAIVMTLISRPLSSRSPLYSPFSPRSSIHNRVDRQWHTCPVLHRCSLDSMSKPKHWTKFINRLFFKIDPLTLKGYLLIKVFRFDITMYFKLICHSKLTDYFSTIKAKVHRFMTYTFSWGQSHAMFGVLRGNVPAKWTWFF